MPSSHPRPIAVLFDLDGTLVDTIQLLLESVQYAFRDHVASGRRAPSEAEWIAGIGTPLVTQLRPYVSHDAELAALVAGYRVYQGQHHDRLTRCYTSTPDVVAALKARGHPLGIVTSKADEIARRSLSHVGLLDMMDTLAGADSTTRHKPDPEPVLLALERLGYGPDEAIFVGDSPHDVNAGNAAGVTTVAALWGPFDRAILDAARPTHVIASITELPGLVSRIEGSR